jgi:hypothetical protein
VLCRCVAAGFMYGIVAVEVGSQSVPKYRYIMSAGFAGYGHGYENW